jgi:hypothetical protein
MYWNYRVVNVEDDPNEEPFYEICEVFYDENDEPSGWSKSNIKGEDITVVAECMRKMTEALTEPILEAADFIGKFYDHEGDMH